METKDCIYTRRSIRKFLDKPVEKAAVEEMVKLASYSPSWKNTQVVRYTAIEDPELKGELADNCVLGFGFNTKTIRRAPLLIVMSYVQGISGYEKDGTPTTPKNEHWEVFDCGIACQTLSIAAHELGLGTVIMGIFDDAAVKDLLKLPEEERVACLIAVGYPDVDPAAPPRKDVAELLRWK